LFERAWGFESLRPHFSRTAVTHPPALVAYVLRRAADGLNAVEISREIAIPRRTIADWITGKVPTGGRTRANTDPFWSRCESCSHEEHDFEALTPSYVYLLGMYLGDGCISAGPRDVYRLRIALDLKYPLVIAEVKCAIGDVMPENKVGCHRRQYNCVDVYAYSKAWPCFFPQHGPGAKHDRKIALEEWQTRLVDRWPGALLRGLIHSDGCRFMNTGTKWRHPRYSFCNVSEDIKTIFCQACKRLGLRYTTAGPKTIYVPRKADVAVLDRFVGPKA
jgi:hypothetical protein